MNERRQAKRVVITAVAEVTDPDNNLVQEGYVANISTSGIGVFMKRPLKLGNYVEIKMSFYTMGGIKDVEQIKGKVKRVEQISNVYNIGIQFDGLSSSKDRELIAYLNAAHETL
ncbi:MAG: PilZ domain-containing protein [Nitrospira sp.]|nr:PilZ domain-containing protein [Nitrospira sp.]